MSSTLQESEEKTRGRGRQEVEREGRRERAGEIGRRGSTRVSVREVGKEREVLGGDTGVNVCEIEQERRGVHVCVRGERKNKVLGGDRCEYA